MDPRSIDPTECWVRHVRRGVASDPSAQPIATGYLVRDDVVRGVDGVNGRQGWQEAETTCVLSDDGSWSLTLPNAAGDDGVLHKRRFRCLTDDAYEPGEEWLEFWTDADAIRPLFVGTPTDYSKTTSTVTLKGADLTAVLTGSLSSDVDLWDAAAPADVIRHYSRLPVLVYGADSGLADRAGAAGAYGTALSVNLTGVQADCWTAAARLRWKSAAPAAAGQGKVRAVIAGLTVEVDCFDGTTTITGAPERPVTGRRVGLVVPGMIDVRVVARYDHIFVFVAGELVGEFRRPAPFPAVPTLAVAAYGSGNTAAVDGLHVETLYPFAARAASAVIDRAIGGIPPATGLRAQYWNAAPVYAQNTTRDGLLARLWPLTGELADPSVDRVEPTVAYATGAPPNMAGAYAARWSGAIYLDLAASDRDLRLSGLVGNARVYVGRTLRGDEGASSWSNAGTGTATITLAGLRAWLGTSAAGWFPIVVEQSHNAAAYGITLEDRVAGGAYATVPTSRLSPIGVFSDLVRLTPHRQVIGDVARDFGLQWRIDPRSLESGEFPGQLSARALIGRMTDVVIDDDSVGTDVSVEGSAGDVVDGILADAAGMADPSGAGQLTIQSVDYTRAAGHLALRQSYESLAEVSEEPLAAARVDSLLALKSSPNEQVGVRPTGQRDLVDTFPLTGTLARLDWQPGDGVRLDLDSVDVADTSPRQMTQVTWGLRPDGVGAPTVGFRQRPRTVKAAMQRLARAIYGPRRNYQGGVAILTGAPGSNAAGAASDSYSRVPLPANLDDVVRAVVVVRSVSAAGWRIEFGDVDLGTDGAVGAVGRYDVTRGMKNVAAIGVPRTHARLIGGTGTYEITIEVWVRV